MTRFGGNSAFQVSEFLGDDYLDSDAFASTAEKGFEGPVTHPDVIFGAYFQR